MSEIHLGDRIRSLRTEQDLSIRKLASKAGITASMLSQIEKDQTNPSINTLRAVAQALDMPICAFFNDEKCGSQVVRPGKRLEISFKNGPGVSYELLTPDTRGDMVFCVMTVPAGSSSSDELRSHEGEEAAYMLSGEKTELELEGRSYTLFPGDSIRIPPRACHVWHNTGSEDASVIIAVTQPAL